MTSGRNTHRTSFSGQFRSTWRVPQLAGTSRSRTPDRLVGQKNEQKSYFLQDGLLYRKQSGGKLCIPKSLRADVIREVHDAILGEGPVEAFRYQLSRAVTRGLHRPSGKSLCAQLGIKLKMSTAYHPQTDGQAEKANATLETFLKAYVTQLPSSGQWSQLLPLAEFAYLRNHLRRMVPRHE